MGIQFRLSPKLFRDLQKEIAQDTAVEQGCFLLCSEAKTHSNHILIAKRLLPLQENDFKVQKRDLLSVSPSTMLRVSRMAQADNSGICFIHTHPMSFGTVGFSMADDYGNVRTFDFLNRMVPGKANSALVFSGDMKAVSGRLYHTANSWKHIESVSVAGSPSKILTMNNDSIKEETRNVNF